MVDGGWWLERWEFVHMVDNECCVLLLVNGDGEWWSGG